MDKLFFTIEAIVEKQYCLSVGRSLIGVLIKRLEELARENKIDEETLRYWTFETLSDCAEKQKAKEATESAYSKAAYRDEPESPELIKELRKARDDAEKEFQEALVCLKAETLKLLRAK